MDPLTTIAAAQQSFKAVLGIARATTSAVVDHEVKAKLIEIQEGILDAQAKLGDAQAERLDLLHQVAELKEKVRAFETAKAALDGYVMHELAPGIKVFKSKPDAGHAMEHFACPRCYSGGAIGIIQQGVLASGRTRWSCSVCDFQVVTGKGRPMPSGGRFGGGSALGT